MPVRPRLTAAASTRERAGGEARDGRRDRSSGRQRETRSTSKVESPISEVSRLLSAPPRSQCIEHSLHVVTASPARVSSRHLVTWLHNFGRPRRRFSSGFCISDASSPSPDQRASGRRRLVRAALSVKPRSIGPYVFSITLGITTMATSAARPRSWLPRRWNLDLYLPSAASPPLARRPLNKTEPHSH